MGSQCDDNMLNGRDIGFLGLECIRLGEVVFPCYERPVSVNLGRRMGGYPLRPERKRKRANRRRVSDAAVGLGQRRYRLIGEVDC